MGDTTEERGDRVPGRQHRADAAVSAVPGRGERHGRAAYPAAAGQQHGAADRRERAASEPWIGTKMATGHAVLLRAGGRDGDDDRHHGAGTVGDNAVNRADCSSAPMMWRADLAG